MSVDFSALVWIATAIFLGFILVIALMKWRQVRKARSWRSARGRVVTSRVESRTERGTRDIPRSGNFALIEYRYTVDGTEYTGTRVGLGEAMPDFEVDETLTRYPEGREVEIFYDPKDPANAVLERSVPQGVGTGLLVLVLFIGGIGVGGYLYFTRGVVWLDERLPEGSSDPMLIAILLFAGVLAVLVALAMLRRAGQAARWRRASGEIIAAEVVKFSKLRGHDRYGSTIFFAPHVTYRYTVEDREYEGSRLHLGGEVSYGAESLARKMLERYRVGAQVSVRYNPSNAAESTLDERAKGAWILLAVAVALLAAAWFAAQPGVD